MNPMPEREPPVEIPTTKIPEDRTTRNLLECKDQQAIPEAERDIQGE